MKTYIFNTIMSLLTIFLVSCSNSGLESEISGIMDTKIIIPFEKLDKRECSFFKDTLDSPHQFTLVVYLEGIKCTSCELSELSEMEKSNSDDDLWRRTYKVFIISSDPENVDDLYALLCNQRIKNDVFLDTCGIFRKTNPIIPDSKLFHSFVLDGENKVILVGNPFKNYKLKELFSRIVEEEMTKRRK